MGEKGKKSSGFMPSKNAGTAGAHGGVTGASSSATASSAAAARSRSSGLAEVWTPWLVRRRRTAVKRSSSEPGGWVESGPCPSTIPESLGSLTPRRSRWPAWGTGGRPAPPGAAARRPAPPAGCRGSRRPEPRTPRGRPPCRSRCSHTRRSRRRPSRTSRLQRLGSLRRIVVSATRELLQRRLAVAVPEQGREDLLLAGPGGPGGVEPARPDEPLRGRERRARRGGQLPRERLGLGDQIVTRYALHGEPDRHRARPVE